MARLCHRARPRLYTGTGTSHMLQPAAARKISDQTALNPYNLNVPEETRRRLHRVRDVA